MCDCARCGGWLVSRRTWYYHNRSKRAWAGGYKQQQVSAGDGDDAASARLGGDAAGFPMGGDSTGSAGSSQWWPPHPVLTAKYRTCNKPKRLT